MLVEILAICLFMPFRYPESVPLALTDYLMLLHMCQKSDLLTEP